MTPATFESLLLPEGTVLMAQIEDLSQTLDDLALGSRLRREHPAELVAAAISQHHLRRKATAKFGDHASRMWFTSGSLEQATRRRVAKHRAEQLRARGATTVVDLGCGVGGDLMAMARHGISVRGVEADPVRAAMANANLAALGLPQTVTVGDALAADLADDEVAFIDPARRDGRGRITSLDGLQPPWEFVTRLLMGRAVAKVMPGIAHDQIPPRVGAEWVSDHGSLVEASLWGAGFGSSVRRRATVLPSGTTLRDRGVVPTVGPVDAFLVEPDDAVIRAGLVAELAAKIDGVLVDPHIAWVTTAKAPAGKEAHLGRWFKVVAELPFRTKALKAALVERDIGTLTVKKRGVHIVPEQLISQLKLRGSVTATIVMTRVNGMGRAFLVEPQPRTP